jgi:hypothetical protein
LIQGLLIKQVNQSLRLSGLGLFYIQLVDVARKTLSWTVCVRLLLRLVSLMLFINTMVNVSRLNSGSSANLQKGSDLLNLVLPESSRPKGNQPLREQGEFKLAKLDREHRLLPIPEQIKILENDGFKKALDFTYKFDPNDTGNSGLNIARSVIKLFDSFQTGKGKPELWAQINYDELSAHVAQIGKAHAALNNRNITREWMNSNIDFVIRDISEKVDKKSPYVEVTVTVMIKP